MTNGDKIRAMSDEELVKFLNADSCFSCVAKNICKHGYLGNDEHCRKLMLRWLKQEVKHE